MPSGCSVSSLAARFAFFPPEPATYAVRKDEATGRLVASGVPRDNAMDVLLVDTSRGNKVVAFYFRNPCARLTLLYSHGNAADLGQLYDLFVQLKNVVSIEDSVYMAAYALLGTDDDVVDWSHGKELWRLAREPHDPLWIKGGGHCNLELYPDFIRHLSRFVREMETVTTKARLRKIRPALHQLRKKAAHRASTAATTTTTTTFTANCCCRVRVRKPTCPSCGSFGCGCCGPLRSCLALRFPRCCRPPAACFTCGGCCWSCRCRSCFKCCCC
ncbi:alpha/beta-Hydrolases superfamily protein [Zea mays]|uniref:Alpha/beta-Hydrolases superfamily protein n=1 Tax=Zea mays TaxID=4577 RepID=A0A1D6J007_MAIZE|nr:alpha/beta-Hydrolases superfamily protein [Zea mays]